MLVTPVIDHQNRRTAMLVVGVVGLLVCLLGMNHPLFFLGFLLLPLAWWAIRRRTVRRESLMRQPLPPERERILLEQVAYYRALDETNRLRFRQMMTVFLAEIRITGVGTEVDETVIVLVGASAIIPIFGFHDWDYDHLGEVLIYPGSFDDQYKTSGGADANILGLVGMGHLRGVMVLSKPDLLHGYANPADRQNVGIHEFTHLVEDTEGRKGLPPEVPPAVVYQWLLYVAQELNHPSANHRHINAYAYTNQHEFLAVLSEYFFEAPEVLQKKAPKLYEMLRTMFHQDPMSLYSHLPEVTPRRKVGRNDLCPCGSGKKFKDCCATSAK